MGHHRFNYRRGDHVCGLCESPDEVLIAATAYIRHGLSRRERCVYACRDEDVPAVLGMLRAAGIQVDAEEARGALLVTSNAGYLRDGTFEPDRLISAMQEALTDALNAGFEGLCLAGDMTWVLHQAPGTERLAEYEARANRFFKENPATGLCLYNHRILPAVVLDHALATHPAVGVDHRLIHTNPFYEEPELAAARAPRPEKVREKMAHLSVRQVHRHAKYPPWH